MHIAAATDSDIIAFDNIYHESDGALSRNVPG